MIFESDVHNALIALAFKWEREVGQYQKAIDEARAKGLDHSCILGTKTGLQQAAKELRALATKGFSGKQGHAES